ncbi:MAG: 50S ribosomal protein L5 [Candidatus Aenigmarchaeota archaeon]|nr:50S ribosomal protein L5 [Candidatus Aenigmarchaeota archaeon]
MSEEKDNKMRELRIEKVVLNIGVGEPGERLENAKSILEEVTKRKPVYRKTEKRSTFGVAKGRNIGVVVTIRGEETKTLLDRLIKAKGNQLLKKSFSGRTFSFGIPEYFDIPGTEYNPKVGVIGLDICVTLERPGYKNKKIGKKHIITSEESISFIEGNFDVKIV